MGTGVIQTMDTHSMPFEQTLVPFGYETFICMHSVDSVVEEENEISTDKQQWRKEETNVITIYITVSAHQAQLQ